MIGEKQKIIIVDDNQGFIDALKYLFENRNDIEIIGEANDALHFFELIKDITPDIVLMDIYLPEINGLIAAKLALVKNNQMKIIGVTMSDDYNVHFDMQRIGFQAGILKTNFTTDFDNALKNIKNENKYFPVLNNN